MMICRCKTCGKLYIGKFEKSLCHDAPMTYYTRVVGFLTPVDSWIEARREEYNARQFYTKDTF
jgi:anaerobic ribonucleoside-triphosphate reductase